MKIISIRTMHGPNIFAHRPVLVMRLDLGPLAGKETWEIDGFNDALVGLLPGLVEHRCSHRRRGGFLERLREGTYFSHTVEHVALELSELAGIPSYFGKAISTDVPGIFHIMAEFVNEQGMRFLLGAACDLVDALVEGKDFPLQERIAEARDVIARSELGPSTRAIVDAAERRGFPWKLLSEGQSMIEIGYGCNRRRIQAALAEQTGAISVDIASDKQLTKDLLAQAMIPVPEGRVVGSAAEAIMAFEEIGAPVAVKPLDANQGKGVTLSLNAASEVIAAFTLAAEFSRKVLVEQMVQGNDYRVLVVGGRVAAAAHRHPAQIVGNGTQTIRELVAQQNRDPARGKGHSKPLTFIEVTDVVLRNLAHRGLTLDDVPEAGRTVFLCQTANLSVGGTAVDVTDLVHPDVARTCERAARVVGIDICGIDLVMRDIGRPMERSNGRIIEVNASPGLRMHLHPTQGRPRAVGEAIIEMLYPRGTSARIPIISITGTNGKTTVTRLIGYMLAHAGRKVGMTTTDGMFIRGELVARGDLTGFQSARTILSDPAVDTAVLETARGGIVRSGLGYDWSDISVVTTIQPDHVGQDGIQSVDDIFHIKSLVAERVREGGTLVLNMDDERVASMANLPRVRKPGKDIVYYSHLLGWEELRRRAGGNTTGYCLKDGWIVEVKGLQQLRISHVSEIPLTLNGLAEFNVSNVMAAIAAARAFGLSAGEITQSLTQFSADGGNPGRANLFRVHRGYVLLDYGHNAEAIAAVARMSAATGCPRVTGIVAVPGDRADWVIEEAGRVAARGFQRLVIREDADLRGRRSGEVARLLHDAVRKEAPGRECHVVLDLYQAFERAVADMQDEEMIVVFYEDFEKTLEFLRLRGAVPLQTIEVRRPATVKTAI